MRFPTVEKIKCKYMGPNVDTHYLKKQSSRKLRRYAKLLMENMPKRRPMRGWYT